MSYPRVFCRSQDRTRCIRCRHSQGSHCTPSSAPGILSRHKVYIIAFTFTYHATKIHRPEMGPDLNFWPVTRTDPTQSVNVLKISQTEATGNYKNAAARVRDDMYMGWSCPTRLGTSDSCCPAMPIKEMGAVERTGLITVECLSTLTWQKYSIRLLQSGTRNTAVKPKPGQTPGLIYWPDPTRPKSLICDLVTWKPGCNSATDQITGSHAHKWAMRKKKPQS